MSGYDGTRWTVGWWRRARLAIAEMERREAEEPAGLYEPDQRLGWHGYGEPAFPEPGWELSERSQQMQGSGDVGEDEPF